MYPVRAFSNLDPTGSPHKMAIISSMIYDCTSKEVIKRFHYFRRPDKQRKGTSESQLEVRSGFIAQSTSDPTPDTGPVRSLGPVAEQQLMWA